MRITVEDGLALLYPTTEEERAAFRGWEHLGPGERLRYMGRGPDDGDEFWTIVLAAADTELRLRGDAEIDKERVNELRNLCYFGPSGGLIYLGRRGDHLVVTGAYCKFCGDPMVEWTRAEWRVCTACAECCSHSVVVQGLTHGPNVELDVGPFCERCGLARSTAAAG